MLRTECLGTPDGHANRAYNVASLEPLVKTPPSPLCEVCAIVPVRDEAENLTTTLDALAHQIDLENQPFDRQRYEIILLANNCCDNSAAIARSFAKQHPTLALHVVEIALPASEAYIGRVRRILMDEAYRRLTSLGKQGSVIASTDGDTRVAPTWIAATLHEIYKGADAVGGRILTDRAGRMALDPYAHLCHLQEVGYRYLLAELETYLDPNPDDPWPRHYQHFGASFAVTAQMYGRAGGMPAVRSPEDVAFYHALLRVDARFRHSPDVRVVTSARQVGRTKNGLANQLSEWTVMGRKHQRFLVESPAVSEVRLQARHRLRVLWQRSRIDHHISEPEISPIAGNLAVATGFLAQQLRQQQPFGLLLEHVIAKQEGNAWLESMSLVEIRQAIYQLRDRLNHWRRGAKYPLNPLEQIKPVLLLPPTSQMSQIKAGSLQERVMNLIATERVIAGVKRPMNEQ